MTEKFRSDNLTSRAQNPYPENGDIFMPEPGQGEVQKGPQRAPEIKSQNTTLSELQKPYLDKGVLKKAWATSFGKPYEKLTHEERLVADFMTEKGEMPQKQRAVKSSKSSEAEVYANAALAMDSRIAGVEKMLGRQLSNVERKALEKVHEMEAGWEEGVDGGKPGVYNYTPQQLRDIIEGLREGGFTKTERRELVEKGYAGLPVDEVFTDELVQGIVNAYNSSLERAGGPGSMVDRDILLSQIGSLQEVIANPDVGTDARQQAERALDLLNENYESDRREEREIAREQAEARQRERNEEIAANLEARAEGSFFYITPEDRRILSEGGILSARNWVNQKVDQLYRTAIEGQDVSQNPLLQRLQQSFSDSIAFLQYEPDKVKELNATFNTRLGLLSMRNAFGVGEMEGVVGTARFLTGHGLMNAFNLDDGQVGAMFSRYTDKLEFERQKAFRGHMTPDMVESTRADLIEEQLKIALTGEGYYGNFYKNSNLLQTELGNAKDGRGIYKTTYEDVARRFTGIPQQEGVDRDQQLEELREAVRALPQEQQDQIDEFLRQEITRAEITRAVEGGFDLFVSTQRMGVHMARGEFLPNPRAYRSEPYSVFNFYNIEALLHEKYNTFTEADQEFMRQVKLDLARDYFEGKKIPGTDKVDKRYNPSKMTEAQLEDVGKVLLRDLYKIPDVLTSGWRIEAVATKLDELFKYRQALSLVQPGDLTAQQQGELVRQIEQGKTQQQVLSEILTKDQVKSLLEKLNNSDDPAMVALQNEARAKAEDMGLFMRLQAAGDLRAEGWIEKYAQSLGEEKAQKLGISKKDKNGEPRKDDDIRDNYRRMLWGKVADYRPEEIIRLFRERDPRLLPGGYDLENRHCPFYDDFKEKYGDIVSNLRTRAFAEGRQLDTTNLTPEEIATVDAIFQDGTREGSIADLQAYFGRMHDFINNAEIKDRYINQKRSVIEALIKDDRFAVDIYQRALVVDDAMLGEIEAPPANSGIISASQTIGITPSGDMLVRMMKDTAQGKEASEHLAKFFTEEHLDKKVEAAIEFAEKTTYNGLGNRARGLRFTVGTAFELSRIPFLWDAIGVSKFPLRKAMTDYERIYGYGSHIMTADEIRSKVDQIENLLVEAMNKPNLEDEERKLEELREEGKSEKEVNKEIDKYRAEQREIRAKDKKHFLHDVEKLTRLRGRDVAGRKAVGLVAFLLLAILAEGVNVSKETAKS